MLGRNSLLSG